MNCSLHGTTIANLAHTIPHPAIGLTDWLVPLASSLLGAAVGALALILIYRLQALDRAEDAKRWHAERFEGALADLMRQIYSLAAELRKWDKDEILRRRNWQGSLKVELDSDFGGGPERPKEDAVLSAHEVAQLIADPDERAPIQPGSRYRNGASARGKTDLSRTMVGRQTVGLSPATLCCVLATI